MTNSAVAHDEAPEGGRLARLWPLVWVAWLVALADPITALLHAHPSSLRLGAILAGLVIFVVVYLWAAWHNDVSCAASASIAQSSIWRWGPIAVPPAVEAALAWTVREGVTNVIRHSRARHCTIRTTQDAGHVGVEIGDDGRGPGAARDAVPRLPGTGSGSGSGLPGVSERWAALGGRCEAGPDPAGGFRLAVVAPLTTEPGTTTGERAVAHADAGTRA